MKMIRAGIITLSFVFLAAVPAVAGTWYIGGGINSVSLGGDLGDVDPGAGLAFNFGYNYPNTTMAPYITVGLGSHVLDYDHYNTSFEGGSLYIGGGFDYYITPGHSIDVGVRFHSWSVDVNQGGVIWTDVGDATTTVVAVMYNYHFIM